MSRPNHYTFEDGHVAARRLELLARVLEPSSLAELLALARRSATPGPPT